MSDEKHVDAPLVTAPSHETIPTKSSWVFVLFALAAAFGVAFGAWKLFKQSKQGIAQAAEARSKELGAGPKVLTAKVRASAAGRSVGIIGEARPFTSVTLYSKVSGYVRVLPVDKGDVVKEGDLLAVVESPETDSQWVGVREDAKFKRSEAKRYRDLVKAGVASEQDAAKTESAALVAEATLAQLAAQRSYEVLRAPFAGTVTARFADPGALVQSAQNAQTSALPVVALADLDKIRVFAYLDQRDAAYVKVGDAATLTLDERPGFSIATTVTRLAGAMDMKSRTMLVEVDVDNKKRQLVPGGWVRLRIELRVPSFPEIPSNALIMRGTQAMVAVVGDDGRVKFRNVEVADVDGERVRLVKGVSIDETVAMNLGEQVPDGALVRPVAAPAPSASGSAR